MIGSSRILVLSAPVGEGHVAAARALAARMRTLWPRAEVHEVESVGPGRDRLLRDAYALVMRTAPSLYGLAYDTLTAHPHAADVFKADTARRVGRTLAPLVKAERPRLVISTHPMVSGGLAWLRGRGLLPGRAVAVATDAAVHPFWVWPELDETWTLLPGSRRQALRIAPTADVRVAPPAVDAAFRPGERVAARRASGLREDACVVLVTGGSLAFGDLGRVVDAVLAAGSAVQAVVLCGHDERLAARLDGRGLPRARLVPLRWTDQVPTLVTASDLVLTTAGGVIATEALAAGRPLLFAMPVPGHGRASAALLAEAGLATVCPRPADVTAAVRAFVADPARLAAFAERAELFRGDLDAELRLLAQRVETQRF
jgi:UDP-N-acetylglucosamine:LPS N-acetylglucosamine transferase